MNKNIYIKSFLNHIPRLLGQINSNPGSRTYGCCDRNYWHNNITAFPNARYQESILTLTLLYKHFDTPYRNSSYILTLINAGISFWMKMQEKDGSFNEWYPHEGSYVATAFSSYAISETLLLLGEDLIKEHQKATLCLEKSVSWLMIRSQKGVCNQQSGALMAIYNTYMLTKKEAFKKAIKDYETLIISCQNKEGWFMEYGGPDIGYLSLTIDYLAKYWKKSNSKAIEQVLTKALNFIVNFIHDDGTSGGVYTSRETKYLIPHGFELLAPHNEQASFIAWVNRRNIKEEKAVSFHSLDDRYFMYIGYTFLQAGLDGIENLKENTIERPKYLYLPEAGLYINHQNGVMIVANLKKTGAFVGFVGPKRISDSGILVDGTKRLFSGYMTHDNKILDVNEKGFTVEGNLKAIKENIMTPMKSVLLNLFQKTIGCWPGISTFVKGQLRKMLILKHKSYPTKLRRTVKFEDGGLDIEDQLEHLQKDTNVIVGANASFIYVPSSRWYEVENLNDRPYEVFKSSELPVDGGCVTIKRTIP